MSELQGMNIAQLRRELEKKQRRVEVLQAKRTKLMSKLADIDAQLAGLLGEKTLAATTAPPQEPAAAPAEKPRRPGRRPRLAETILGVLRKSPEPMNVPQIAAVLVRRRFPTRSKNITGLVREALSRVDGIKRVSRGLYAVA